MDTHNWRHRARDTFARTRTFLTLFAANEGNANCAFSHFTVCLLSSYLHRHPTPCPRYCCHCIFPSFSDPCLPPPLLTPLFSMFFLQLLFQFLLLAHYAAATAAAAAALCHNSAQASSCCTHTQSHTHTVTHILSAYRHLQQMGSKVCIFQYHWRRVVAANTHERHSHTHSHPHTHTYTRELGIVGVRQVCSCCLSV